MFITTFNAIKESHECRIKKYAEPLLWWMYTREILIRGYCTVDDYPDWISVDARHVIQSRSRLWFAMYQQIALSSLGPMLPVNLFKQSIQFIYNKGKKGMDKATELEERIRHGLCLCFERKYIIRLINAIEVNSWSVHQALEIRPMLTARDLHVQQIGRRFSTPLSKTLHFNSDRPCIKYCS